MDPRTSRCDIATTSARNVAGERQLPFFTMPLSSHPSQRRLLVALFVFVFVDKCVGGSFIRPVATTRLPGYQDRAVNLLQSGGKDIENTSIDAEKPSAVEQEGLSRPGDQPTVVQHSFEKEVTSNDIMLAMGTSPRRIAISLLSAGGIALAGNLFGVTSLVLQNVDENTVAATGLDTFYPRGDYKRVRTPDYTFVIPKDWVADTSLELAKSQRMAQPLDYAINKGRSGVLPDCAYGPPGQHLARGASKSITNVSVITSKVGPNFSLRETMKTPTEGAAYLLENSIGPPQGAQGTLLGASESGGLYQFEYILDKGERAPRTQSISVLAERGGSLFTLTVVGLEKEWKENAAFETKLRKVAGSFQLR